AAADQALDPAVADGTAEQGISGEALEPSTVAAAHRRGAVEHREAARTREDRIGRPDPGDHGRAPRGGRASRRTPRGSRVAHAGRGPGWPKHTWGARKAMAHRSGAAAAPTRRPSTSAPRMATTQGDGRRHHEERVPGHLGTGQAAGATNAPCEDGSPGASHRGESGT